MRVVHSPGVLLFAVSVGVLCRQLGVVEVSSAELRFRRGNFLQAPCLRMQRDAAAATSSLAGLLFFVEGHGVR